MNKVNKKGDTEKDFGIKESVIPFGASDSELMEATYFIPQGFHAVIDGNKVIIKKGEDPVSNDLEEVVKKYLTSLRKSHFEGYDIERAFKKGAQWQKEQMIDKACEWLQGFMEYSNLFEYEVSESEQNKVINDFKKAMEE